MESIESKRNYANIKKLERKIKTLKELNSIGYERKLTPKENKVRNRLQKEVNKLMKITNFS